MGKIFLRGIKVLMAVVILSLVLGSCSQRGPYKPSMREWAINLHDSSGTLYISLPLSFDTMHSWLSQDDNPGSDMYYCRIQSSKSSMVEEAGFFKYMSDTVYRMTLIRPMRPEPVREPFDAHRIFANALQRSQLTGIQLELGKNIDTITITANGSQYACISTIDTLYTDNAKGRVNTTVSVFNTYKGDFRLIIFESTLNNYKDTTFTRQCLDAVRTIRFVANPIQ